MAKTETQIDLKINKGTYDKIQENLSQIGENELIITDDKNIPVPVIADEGKVLYINNGDYTFENLRNVLGIEVVVQQLGEGTTTISLTQEQEDTLLLHSKEPTQIIVRIVNDQNWERYYFQKQIETETIERYTCEAPTASALYSYMLQYTKQSGELVLYDSVEVQLKNLITDIETHKTENGSYPSTKAVYDFCQTLGVPTIEISTNIDLTTIGNSAISFSADNQNIIKANYKKPLILIINSSVSIYPSGTYPFIFYKTKDNYVNTSAVGTMFTCFNQNEKISATVSGGNLLNITRVTLETTDNKKTSVASNSSSDTYYPTIKAVYDFVKSETKYLVVSDYSALPTTNVSEGMLAYCQNLYVPYEAGFYQYKNSVWSKIELENPTPVNVSITGNFDPTQTFTFTIDGDDIIPLMSGAPLVITFTGGGSSIFQPDFFQISQTEYTSSAVVVLNGTQYIATINFDLSLQSNNAILSFSEIEGGGGSQASEQFTKIKLHTTTTQSWSDPDNVSPDITETLTEYFTYIIPKSNDIFIVGYANALLGENFTSLDELFTYLNTAITSSGSTDGTMVLLYRMMCAILSRYTPYKIELNFDYKDEYSIPVENTTNYAMVIQLDNAELKAYIGFNTSTDQGSSVSFLPDKIYQIEYSDYSFGGGSSGSGTSDVLYKHSAALDVIDEDNNSLSATFEFLSKHSTPFVTNGSLVDMLTSLVATNDSENIINPLCNIDNNWVIVSQIYPDVSNYRVRFNFVNNGLVFVLDANFSDNTNITDTVTPYIQVSGGSSQPTIPERFSLAYNLVVNINQEQFANGSWTGSNSDNIRTFQYNGSNADETKAKELVEFLTGVNVLDRYNATKPTPCFVFCTQSNICWKLQWDNSLLHAYKVENFPFVTNTNAIDYIEVKDTVTQNAQIVFIFQKGALNTSAIQTSTNQLIDFFNQQYSLSIPSYSKIEDFYDINEYLTDLPNTYDQVKIVFYSALFSVMQFWSLSVKGYVNGEVVPISMEALFDQANSIYVYNIKYLSANSNPFGYQTAISSNNFVALSIHINDFD